MFDLSYTDPSWQPILKTALAKMDLSYLDQLEAENDFLPTADKIFNAFRLPIDKVNYVLFGESPYPREESANGFSFWDQRVDSIWSDGGLSKEVNKATSLRNLIKTMLISENYLDESNIDQHAISMINKNPLAKTLDNLFNSMINNGFLLLNATLVLRSSKKYHDAKHWSPFINHILNELYQHRPKTQLILFGKIAEKIQSLPASQPFVKLVSEHPYNHSFITNKAVQKFFSSLNLLTDRPRLLQALLESSSCGLTTGSSLK